MGWCGGSMATKIGLISDTHSTVAPLKEALSIFQREQVEMIVCAGDIAGYGEDELAQTIDLLLQNDCKMVAGNHDKIVAGVDYGGQLEKITTFFNALPLTREMCVDSKKIYIVHAHPPESQHGGIKLLDPHGRVRADRKAYWRQQLEGLNVEVLIVGHTHQVFAEQIGGVLVINPGSTQFNHSCMILHLPDMRVDIFALSNKPVVMTWNWGLFYN
jgi:putative phosphoesterase